jgi:hypothetical protein
VKGERRKLLSSLSPNNVSAAAIIPVPAQIPWQLVFYHHQFNHQEYALREDVQFLVVQIGEWISHQSTLPH